MNLLLWRSLLGSRICQAVLPSASRARAQVRSSFESDMRLQFGNLNFTGRGFSSDFSSVAEDYGGGAQYDTGASAATQALAEPPAASRAASSSAAMDAFKAAGGPPHPRVWCKGWQGQIASSAAVVLRGCTCFQAASMLLRRTEALAKAARGGRRTLLCSRG